MLNYINEIDFCESLPEELIYHQQKKLIFLKALNYINLKGKAKSNGFRVGALIYSGNLDAAEIRMSLNLSKQSYKDAIKQLKAWCAEWMNLSCEGGV